MSDLLTVMICGSKGRMGQTLIALAEAENVRVVAQKDIGDSLADGIEAVKVAIDFSHHTATPEAR
jgi:dihydrodipicolinate reductase